VAYDSLGKHCPAFFFRQFLLILQEKTYAKRLLATFAFFLLESQTEETD